jgi:hypothetical protein
MSYENMTVLSRDGSSEGKITTVCENRHCGCESCFGRVLRVKWNDGDISYPCSAGLEHNDDQTLQII